MIISGCQKLSRTSRSCGEQQSNAAKDAGQERVFKDNCGGGACGGGAGCPWVAGRLGANGGHVMIAVRSGLSRRLGAAGAGAAGSAPV